jgi:hypothetical protein
VRSGATHVGFSCSNRLVKQETQVYRTTTIVMMVFAVVFVAYRETPKDDGRTLSWAEAELIVGGAWDKHCYSGDPNSPCNNALYLCMDGGALCSEWYEEQSAGDAWWTCIAWPFGASECHLDNEAVCKTARGCKEGPMGMCVIDLMSSEFDTVTGMSTCTGAGS